MYKPIVANFNGLAIDPRIISSLSRSAYPTWTTFLHRSKYSKIMYSNSICLFKFKAFEHLYVQN